MTLEEFYAEWDKIAGDYVVIDGTLFKQKIRDVSGTNEVCPICGVFNALYPPEPGQPKYTTYFYVGETDLNLSSHDVKVIVAAADNDYLEGDPETAACRARLLQGIEKAKAGAQ